MEIHMKKRAIGILAAALLAPTIANSAVITGTDSLYSIDDLTQLDNGLEFLDLSYTIGMNYNDAEAAYVADGFRIATYTDTTALLSGFGIDASGWNGTDDFWNFSSTEAQRDTFNATLDFTSNQNSLAWFDYTGLNTNSYLCIGDGCLNQSFVNDWNTSSDQGIATLLVRDTTEVSEPASIALLGLGLLGLGMVRRKQA
jgi:hypothetical protein